MHFVNQQIVFAAVYQFVINVGRKVIGISYVGKFCLFFVDVYDVCVGIVCLDFVCELTDDVAFAHTALPCERDNHPLTDKLEDVVNIILSCNYLHAAKVIFFVNHTK